MIDIPKFAKKAGVTEGTAKNILIKLRKKIAEGEESDEAPATTKAPAPKKKATKKPAAGKGKKAAEDQNAESEEDE